LVDIDCPQSSSTANGRPNAKRTKLSNSKSCNAQAHGKRNKKKEKQNRAEGLGHHPPKAETIARHVEKADPILTDLKIESLPATSGGFTALGKCQGKGIYFKSMEELLNDGYTEIRWDG
ncbi:hypothetical protein C0991_005083, partial [Blastosporella zonata]